jgi:hypothetical protein
MSENIQTENNTNKLPNKKAAQELVFAIGSSLYKADPDLLRDWQQYFTAAATLLTRVEETNPGVTGELLRCMTNRFPAIESHVELQDQERLLVDAIARIGVRAFFEDRKPKPNLSHTLDTLKLNQPSRTRVCPPPLEPTEMYLPIASGGRASTKDLDPETEKAIKEASPALVLVGDALAKEVAGQYLARLCRSINEEEDRITAIQTWNLFGWMSPEVWIYKRAELQRLSATKSKKLLSLDRPLLQDPSHTLGDLVSLEEPTPEDRVVGKLAPKAKGPAFEADDILGVLSQEQYTAFTSRYSINDDTDQKSWNEVADICQLGIQEAIKLTQQTKQECAEEIAARILDTSERKSLRLAAAFVEFVGSNFVMEQDTKVIRNALATCADVALRSYTWERQPDGRHVKNPQYPTVYQQFLYARERDINAVLEEEVHIARTIASRQVSR